MTDIDTRLLFPSRRILASSYSRILDAVGEYFGGVIVFPKSGTLTYVSFVTAAVTTGGTFTVRLETIDATGAPTGNLYVANATGDVVIADADDNVVKHCSINGGAGVEVVEGDVAAVLIIAPAGVNAAFYVSESQSSYEYPYTIWYAAAALTRYPYSPLIGLVIEGVYYSPSGCIAPAFITTATTTLHWGSDHNPDRRGASFTPPIDMRAIGMIIMIDFETSPTFYLFSTDAATVLETITMYGAKRASTGFGYMFVKFASAQTFTKGATYYWCLLPPDATHIGIGMLRVNLNGALNPLVGDDNGVNMTSATCHGAPVELASWTLTATDRVMAHLVLDRLSHAAGGGGSSLIML